MKWELDALYPGLQMRVGAYHGMNSVLEFVLDPDQDVDSSRKAFYASESPSVGKSKKMLQRRRSDEESSLLPYLSPTLTLLLLSRWLFTLLTFMCFYLQVEL